MKPTQGKSLALVSSALLLLAAGCGGSTTPTASLSFPETALTTVKGTSGLVNVAIRSSPQPPVRGLSNFQFTVTDASGTPVDGLQIAVEPWMPQMGHGSSITPTVTDVGGGVYQVTQVYLFMAGLWQLRTTITGAMSDSVAPEFQIN